MQTINDTCNNKRYMQTINDTCNNKRYMMIHAINNKRYINDT